MADSPPLFLTVIHYSMCTSSIFFGSILFIITLSSSKNMESYATLLRCVTIAEMSTSFGASLLLTRIVPLGINAAGAIICGPAKLFLSYGQLWALFCVFEQSTAQYNVFMTVCFCYRYYVLKCPTPSVNTTRIFATCVFSFTFALYSLYYFAQASREELNPYLLKHVPQYIVYRDSFVGIVDIFTSPGTPAIIWIWFSASAQCLVNISVGRAIFKFLGDKSHTLSDKVRQTHREFAVALALQAVVGQLIAFSIWSYGLGQFDIVRSVLLEYTAHMVHELCVSTSPIITLWFVKPYRKKFLSVFVPGNASQVVVTKQSSSSVKTKMSTV